jgi:hypothetical protein
MAIAGSSFVPNQRPKNPVSKSPLPIPSALLTNNQPIKNQYNTDI